MELVFTKGSGKYDRMDLIRSGAGTESVDCPKQGIIPHDMVHYAVESVLRKRGFLARVAQGEPATFRMTVESETDGVERLVETFQGDGWSGWNSAPEDILDLYRVTCNARECAPLAVTAGDIEAVRGRILELTEQWRAVAVGKSLSLPF
jgi:hypothetical protein